MKQARNAQENPGQRNGGSVQDDYAARGTSPEQRHKEAIKRAKALAPTLKATHKYSTANRKQRALSQIEANGIDSSTGPIAEDTARLA